MSDVATGPGWEMRCGRWQDVLADVTTCDAVITDPPYSKRTHAGFLSGSADKNAHRAACGDQDENIGYGVLCDSEAAELASAITRTAALWVVIWGDDITQAVWSRELRAAGLYVFAPLAWVKWNTTPRLAGDGPASACEWITVARQKKRIKCGSLPGFYMADPVRGGQSDRVVVGQKPLVSVRAIVRDYSRKGDLIVDPYSGGGTTLLAAAMEGRRAIGAECDPETYRKAVNRLRGGVQQGLF